VVPRAPLTLGASYTVSITVNGVAHAWTVSATQATAVAGEPAPLPVRRLPAAAGNARPR
jgi:hypothetical protein